MTRTTLLRVVVGSRAHDLSTPESDFDCRSVYFLPTKEVLTLNPSSKHYEEDFEIQHFLQLATKSNPTILEIFKASIQEMSVPDGQNLLHLFPYVWSSKGVYAAFKGYSNTQFRKIFYPHGKNKNITDARKWKASTAMLRVLLQGRELLSDNDFTIKVKDDYDGLMIPPMENRREESWREYLLQVKNGEVDLAHIKTTVDYLNQKIDDAFYNNPDKRTDFDIVNDYLLNLRQRHW